MAGAINRISMGDRNSDKLVRFFDGQASFADMVFGFFEDGEESLESSCNSGEWVDAEDSVDDDTEDENSCNAEENKAFWEGQDELLQATLHRTSSLESKIRQAIKEALKELISTTGTCCVCRRPVAGGCRSCLQREISDRLRNAGHNCAICKSKWRSQPDMPSGEHTYLEVVDKSNSRKGEVRVVIELNFRAEFEMARASDEYNQLISRLPEVFVGKAERLRALIKILCSAAKKCMKEKKMHLGPWRKHNYVQAKWFGTCERTTTAQALPAGFSDQPRKPRASMLTFDLVEKLPGLHCTAVVVV
ncbi:hypothetical protein L1049_024012 [Liquidambar formosana]|uniref:Uncharacterized protein n=1 Tax=Liquidambar formosana TaxID=63359 RepID=A0AAP0RVA8_LIQFO